MERREGKESWSGLEWAAVILKRVCSPSHSPSKAAGLIVQPVLLTFYILASARPALRSRILSPNVRDMLLLACAPRAHRKDRGKEFEIMPAHSMR